MLCCFPLLQFINDALVCWLAWPAALSAPTDKHYWRWWDFLWDQTLVYTDRNIYFKHCSPASWLSFCLQILAWCICSEPAGTKTATRPFPTTRSLSSVTSVPVLGLHPLSACKSQLTWKKDEIADINTIFLPQRASVQLSWLGEGWELHSLPWLAPPRWGVWEG